MINHREDVEVEHSPCMRVFRVQSPVATALSPKTGSESSTAKRSATGVKSRVLGDDHYKV